MKTPKIWPVIDRELRSMSRNRSTYSNRVAIGFFGVLFTLFIAFADMLSQRGGPSNIGLTMLNFQILVLMSYSVLIGVNLTSDSISSEKREGTLGLLFLTDLSTWHILVGKLAANSFSAVICLLSMVPVMAFTLLYGGVTPGQIAMMFLCCFNNLLLSLIIGLAVSSFVSSARKAVAVSFMVLLIIHLIFPLLMVIAENKLVFFWFLNGWVQVMSLSLSGPFGGNPFGVDKMTVFGLSQLATLLMSCIAFGLASTHLKKSWRRYTDPVDTDGAASTPAPVTKSIKEGADKKSGDTGARSQTTVVSGQRGGLHLTTSRPLDYLFSRRKAEIVSTICLLLLLWFWIYLLQESRANISVAIFGIVLVNLIYKWQWASSIVSKIHRERTAGTLEFVLSTPLRINTLTTSLMRASAHDLKGNIIVVALFNFIMLMAILLKGELFDFNDRDFIWQLMLIIGHYLLLALDIVAIANGGAWLGLVNRHYATAFSKTFLWVVCLPSMITWLVIVLMGIGGSIYRNIFGGRFPFEDLFSGEFFLALGIVICTLWAVGCIKFTKAWLSRYVRIISSTPLNEKINFTKLETELNIYRPGSASRR